MTISTNGTCWYPDGSSIANGDTPCNDTAAAAGEATPCCNGASLCISNGLCLDSGITTRGSCTDSEWGDGCTQYCRDELPTEGAPLRLCTLSLTGSTFACGFPLSNCEEGVNTFTVTSYTLSVARQTQLASWASSYGAEVVATTGAASATLSLATSSATSLATSSTTACASASADKYSDGDMAGVGVGVGVPLLLASLAFLWLWRREIGRSRKMVGSAGVQNGGVQQMMPQPQQYHHGHYQQQVPYQEIGTDGERAELPPK